MHTCNLTQAIDIFQDNLTDIRLSCVANAGDTVAMYSPYTEISEDEVWTEDALCLHTNFLAIERDLKPILNVIKRIDSYRYAKLNPARAGEVTDADIQRAREVSEDWFVGEAQLGTRKPHKGVCQFHPDKDPSLMLMKSKAKGTYYLKCFVCSESWDSIGYIMKRDNVSFIQAVKIING